MSKKQSFAFIAIAAFVHFGLMMVIIAGRLDCGILPHCVSRINKVAGVVLGFPMNVFTWAIYPVGIDFGGFYFIFMFINSILAVSIIWLMLNKILLGRKSRLQRRIRENQ